MSTSTATSDMTPPRSPSIPEPLLDDLLELWCETADYNGEEDCVDIRGALSELGFDTSSLNSSNDDDVLANCKSSYLSPPPTNPSSPKMHGEFEETYTLSSIKSEAEIPDESQESESDPVPEDLLSTEQRSGGGGGDHVLQNLIDCSEELMSYEIDENLLAKMDDNPLQAMGDASSSAAKSVEKLLDCLKQEQFDLENTDEAIIDQEDTYDLFGEPRTKKGRFDFVDDEFLMNDIPDIKQDCMWNGYLGDTSPTAMLGGSSWKQEYTFETLFDEKEKLEVGTSQAEVPSAEDKLKAEKKEKEDAIAAAIAAEEAEKQRQLEDFKIAFVNDHCYALSYDDRYVKESSGKSKNSSSQRKVIQGIIVKSEPQSDKSGSGTTTKKTKILVPLKDLMETLQQKSFLVSPLGPNKKIIRFTGSDTVKAAIVSGQNSIQSKPNHNVRKRPHPKSPNCPFSIVTSISSGSSTSSSNSSSPTPSPSSSSSTTTKKKTKAHNNMERMRRIDLRNSFDNLKKLVPPLAKIPKCSKVEILRRAEEYIKGLRNQEKRLQKEEAQVRQRNALLRSRLEMRESY